MKKNHLILIENDVFDIARELKVIDEGYRVYFNRTKDRFEIHHIECYPTLQLVVPYDTLDYRTVVFVRKTRVGRTVDPLDIDEYNRILEEKKTKKIKEDAVYAAKQILK